ncbi:MAG: HAD family phosphatase [Acidobacteriota bacterium]|nr:HAD family phosphatase [Acidobacteriota bacterium]
MKPSSAPSVRAVLFDYGMVLSGPPLPSAWQQMRDITGLDELTLQREYWAYRHDYDRNTLNGLTFWQRVAKGAHISLTVPQIVELQAADIDLWGEVNEPMLGWVQRLQRARMRTGILSNIGDAMASGLKARHAWIAEFDHCTWSWELNLAKPEPEIYHAAASGLATQPEQILFLDDRIENIRAAHAVGMQAIQYLGHDSFEQEMHRAGLAHLLQLGKD